MNVHFLRVMPIHLSNIGTISYGALANPGPFWPHPNPFPSALFTFFPPFVFAQYGGICSASMALFDSMVRAVTDDEQLYGCVA